MPDATRFILLETSHPGNVGAVARAMKVMGFSDLVLVAPRFPDVLQMPEAIAFASGATDVLQGARIVSDIGQALDGVTCVCATAMTARDFGPPTHAPRELFAELAPAGQRVGFVFGSERYGIANEDVYRCHVCIRIPTHPGYGSLNLSQAVQLIAYEWRQAIGGFDTPRQEDAELADARAVQGVLTHWRSTLEAIGFLDPQAPKKLLPRLNQLANRAQLTTAEVHILRGIARAVDKAAGG